MYRSRTYRSKPDSKSCAWNRHTLMSDSMGSACSAQDRAIALIIFKCTVW